MITETRQDALIVGQSDPQKSHIAASNPLHESESDGNPVLGRVLSDLRTAQHEYGSCHDTVAEAWNALGLVHVHMRRDTEAAKVCHQEALRIFSKNSQHEEAAVGKQIYIHMRQPEYGFE